MEIAHISISHLAVIREFIIPQIEIHTNNSVRFPKDKLKKSLKMNQETTALSCAETRTEDE